MLECFGNLLAVFDLFTLIPIYQRPSLILRHIAMEV